MLSLPPNSLTLIPPASLVVLVLYTVFKAIKRSRRNLPPAPKGVPLLGNALQVPQKTPWAWFEAVGKELSK